MKKLFLAILISLTIFSQIFAVKLSDARQHLITYSLQFQNVPYVIGGTTPSGFDCSGFVDYVFKNGANVILPRRAEDIYNSMVRHGRIITPSQREPGDLVFYTSSSGRVNHVGIYCGTYHGSIKKFEGKKVFISAVSDGPSTGIQLQLMDGNYWKQHYFASARVLPNSQ